MVDVAHEMERRGLDAAAADRRRDDLAAAHRREDRAGVLAARRARARRVARRRRRLVDLLDPDAARDARRGEPCGAGRCCASSTRSSERKPLLPIAEARENKHAVAFDDLATPSFTGLRFVEPSLETLREYIDWQFFFYAWELKGKFPAILDAARGARALRRRARAARRDRPRRAAAARAASTASGRRRPTATISLSRMTTSTRFCFLRQQTAHGDSRPNRSLADYVAPERRLHRRVRGHRRHRPRRARRPVRGRARRLQLDHGEGARRPPRRGVRRVPARGRAARVVRDRAASSRPNN